MVSNMEEALYMRADGVGVLLQHAKTWSKYAKEIITYMEKKALLGLQAEAPCVE